MSTGKQSFPGLTATVYAYEKRRLDLTQEGTLTALREGERARVAALLTEGGMRRRMQDIGLIEGTEVECVQKSPAGDPVAYRIRGALIALRAEDSARVLVTGC